MSPNKSSKNLDSEKLKDSEEKLSSIFDADIDGIAYVDVSGRVVGTNKRLMEMMGYKPGDAVGKNILKLGGIEPKDIPKVAKAMKEVITAGKVIKNLDVMLIRKDGYRLSTKVSAVAVKREGKIIGIKTSIRDITENKRALEELKESEEKYRKLINNLNEGIWILDKNAHTTFVNLPMAKMLGYSIKEMLGKHLFSFMDKQGVEIAKKKLEKRKKGIKEQHDFEFIKKDGTRIYAVLEASPIFDEKRNYAGAIAGVMNITERKKAEEERQENEHKLYSIIQSSPIPLFVISKDHYIVYWNKALEKYSKVRTKNIVGTNYQWRAFYPKKRPCLADLLVDEKIEKIPEWYKGKYSKSKLIKGAYEAIDFFPHMKGGVWLYFTAATIKNVKGDIIGAVETLEDITKQKKTEENLKKINQQFQTKIEEIERFNKFAVGRELRMIELKKKIKELEEKLK